MSENENGNVVTPEVTEHQVVNKKRKWKFIIGGVLVLIAIAVGLYIGYGKLNSNPVSIYKNAINDLYDSLADSLKETEKDSMEIDILNEPVVLKLDATFNSSIAELKDFSGLDYNMELGLDYANKKGNLGVGINDGNEKIINILASIINKDIYLKSDELFTKIIYAGEYDLFSELDLDAYLELNETNVVLEYDNIELILKEMKTILINSLDKDKFEIENAELSANGKSHDVKKVTYILDSENMERSVKYIIENMVKSELLMEALAETIGYTVSDLKTDLNSALEDIDYSDYTTIYVVLYTDKLNEVVGWSIVEDNQEVIKYTDLDDKFNFVIDSAGDKLVVEELSEYTNAILTLQNEEVLTLKIYDDDDDVKVDYVFDYEGVKLTGSVEVRNPKMNANAMSADFSFSIMMNVLGEKYDIELDGSYSLEKTAIETINPSGSVAIENLTEEEVMDLYTKLMTILDRFGLSEMLEGSL